MKQLDHLHVTQFDCSHWAMPGVPNFFAKEVMKRLINKQEAKIAFKRKMENNHSNAGSDRNSVTQRGK